MAFDTARILLKIFRNPEQDLLLFDHLELDIYEKDQGRYYLRSASKGEAEKLVFNENTGKSAPEEIVRQLYLQELTKNYRYPQNLIEIEKHVNFGREIKRADIVVYGKDGITPKIIIEVKAPNEENDIQQLKSYLNAEGAPVGVGINGKTKLILYRPYPKEFDDTLDDIPAFNEDIEDVLTRRKKLDDLRERDLKQIIQTLEELVLANSGADSFDEIFKLIYTKLFDEKEARTRPNQELHFRKSPTGNPDETKKIIEELFYEAKREWPDVFEQSDKIKLLPEHLSVCVGELQDVKLYGSNLRIIDEAFEYLIPDVSKKKKGQFFTPRVVIDMCVQMMNPGSHEYVIDTACGSAGFLVHAMQYVWKNLPDTDARREYASRYLFGIDFDERSTKISRAIMLIAGDGKSHIYKTSSLNHKDYPAKLQGDLKEFKLVKQFADFDKNRENSETLKYLNFDILLANPPFAGEIKEKSLLAQYILGRTPMGKLQNKVERHLLFIERNLDFIKPGGRLAIVLPQGVFNNTTMDYVRQYIMQRARILAVVGLHINSFKPHTGTKTSVLFLQKWSETDFDNHGNLKVSDYPIFFAAQTRSFKDNSGNYIIEKDSNGQIVKDDEDNAKYLSDLDEITSAFIEWGKAQSLDFL